MVKSKTFFTSNQVDLFQHLSEQTALEAASAADLDIGQEFLGALSASLRQAKQRGLSRERIIERMNLCLPELDKPLTLRQLNAWTAGSKEFSEFPARWLPAFVWASGCIAPLLALANAVGYDLVDTREQTALELGKTLVESAALTRKAKTLRQQLECPT